MTFQFGNRSINNLKGVHPHLIKVMQRGLALTPVDYMITEGLRTKERQEQLVKAGASKTMNSRHLTGHAVDIAPIVAGEIRWDWELFRKIAPAIKQAAVEVDVPIVWGGDWKFKDGPHFELDRKKYP
jgi:peptidoglycan L-alanyl-D-glutamate endopeptidase CwlK